MGRAMARTATAIGIYGQRFNSAGTKVGGEFPINTYTTNDQSTHRWRLTPTVTPSSCGRAIGQDGSATAFTASGLTRQAPRSAASSGSTPTRRAISLIPSVAMDADGDAVIVWQSAGQDGSGYGIYGQRFNAAGAKVGGEFQINTYTTNGQRYPIGGDGRRRRRRGRVGELRPGRQWLRHLRPTVQLGGD